MATLIFSALCLCEIFFGVVHDPMFFRCCDAVPVRTVLLIAAICLVLLMTAINSVVVGKVFVVIKALLSSSYNTVLP